MLGVSTYVRPGALLTASKGDRRGVALLIGQELLVNGVESHLFHVSEQLDTSQARAWLADESYDSEVLISEIKRRAELLVQTLNFAHKASHWRRDLLISGESELKLRQRKPLVLVAAVAWGVTKHRIDLLEAVLKKWVGLLLTRVVSLEITDLKSVGLLKSDVQTISLPGTGDQALVRALEISYAAKMQNELPLNLFFNGERHVAATHIISQGYRDLDLFRETCSLNLTKLISCQARISSAHDDALTRKR